MKLAEQDIKGGVMRTVVMAALNFDFAQGRVLSSQSDTVIAYNEDTTTIMSLTNLLKTLRDLSAE